MNRSVRVDPAALAVISNLARDRLPGLIGQLASEIRSRPAMLALVAMSAVACLTSCGNDNVEEQGSTTSSPSGSDIDHSAPPTLNEEKVVIKTRIRGFTGRVLTASVVGDAAFCPGGTVRHEHGSLEIGFPAVNVFSCQTGALKVGFGPGPDQMNQLLQTSDWRVLDGTGSFAGSTGEGTMQVKFKEGDAVIGHETFLGVIVVP